MSFMPMSSNRSIKGLYTPQQTRHGYLSQLITRLVWSSHYKLRLWVESKSELDRYVLPYDNLIGFALDLGLNKLPLASSLKGVLSRERSTSWETKNTHTHTHTRIHTYTRTHQPLQEQILPCVVHVSQFTETTGQVNFPTCSPASETKNKDYTRAHTL